MIKDMLGAHQNPIEFTTDINVEQSLMEQAMQPQGLTKGRKLKGKDVAKQTQPIRASPRKRAAAQPLPKIRVSPRRKFSTQPSSQPSHDAKAKALSQPQSKKVAQTQAKALSQPQPKSLSQPQPKSLSQPQAKTVPQTQAKTQGGKQKQPIQMKHQTNAAGNASTNNVEPLFTPIEIARAFWKPPRRNIVTKDGLFSTRPPQPKMNHRIQPKMVCSQLGLLQLGLVACLVHIIGMFCLIGPYMCSFWPLFVL